MCFFIPVKFMSFPSLVLFFDLADFTCVHSICFISLVNIQFVNASHSTYFIISIIMLLLLLFLLF